MPGFYFPRKGPKNKKELLEKLHEKACGGDWNALALAYLVNSMVPDDRTTRRVFRLLATKVREE